MRNNIKEKLQSVLQKEDFEETDVIYILSRIRKLLEIDGNKKDFKVLNFYCNWALHAQIDDVGPISKQLEKPNVVISLMHAYPDLDADLKRFLISHNLNGGLFENDKKLIKFHHLLSDIYSDTPLILKSKTITKEKITFKKIEGYGGNSGLFLESREKL